MQLSRDQEEIVLSYPEVARVSWAPTALHICWLVGPIRYRKVVIPGRKEAIEEVVELLASRGAPVSRERAAHTEVLGLFGTIASNEFLGLLAGGLVVGGLANIVLAAAGVGGSPCLGAGCCSAPWPR